VTAQLRSAHFCLALGALLLPLRLGAQGSATKETPDAVLTGQVVAEDGIPLAQARIRIVGRTPLVLTGSDGRFTITAVSAGDQVLEVRLLGYVAFVQLVKVVAGQTLEVHVTLVAAPIPLKSIEVKGSAALGPVLEGFEHRRARGNGHFFNQAEIARMQPRVFTDVLRRVPGVILQPASGSFGSNDMVRMNRATGITGARNCPVLFYINGMPFQVIGDMSINQYVAPEDVVGIEVYSGSSQIPPEFQANLLNARCGVIVIWTKVGEDNEGPPPPPSSGEAAVSLYSRPPQRRQEIAPPETPWMSTAPPRSSCVPC